MNRHQWEEKPGLAAAILGTSRARPGPVLRPGTLPRAPTTPPPGSQPPAAPAARRRTSQFQTWPEASGPPARLPALLCPSPARSPLRPSHLRLCPPAPALKGLVTPAVALPSRPLAVLALPLQFGSPPPGGPPGHSGWGRCALVSSQNPLGFPLTWNMTAGFQAPPLWDRAVWTCLCVLSVKPPPQSASRALFFAPRSDYGFERSPSSESDASQCFANFWFNPLSPPDDCVLGQTYTNSLG